MEIKYKFSIGELVLIKALETEGRLLSVWSGRRGSEYQVRYCYNGKFEEVYFFEDELESIPILDNTFGSMVIPAPCGCTYIQMQNLEGECIHGNTIKDCKPKIGF